MYAAVMLLTSVAVSLGGAETGDGWTVDHSARLYRIQVYRAFRHDRAEHERRLADGEAVLAAYQEAGSPEELSGDVIRWFESARRIARPGSTAEAPSNLELLAGLQQVASERQRQEELAAAAALRDLMAAPAKQPVAAKPEAEPATSPAATAVAPATAEPTGSASTPQIFRQLGDSLIRAAIVGESKSPGRGPRID